MSTPTTEASISVAWRARSPKSDQPGPTLPWSNVQGLRVRAVQPAPSAAGPMSGLRPARLAPSRIVVRLPSRLASLPVPAGAPAPVRLIELPLTEAALTPPALTPPALTPRGSLCADLLGSGLLLSCFVLAAILF